MPYIIRVLSLVALTLVPSVVHAELSPELDAMMKTELQYFDSFNRDSFQQYCGYALEMAIDTPSFETRLTDAKAKGQNPDIASECGYPLTEIKELCYNQGFNEQVAAQLKAYKCVASKNGKKSLTLKDGVLTMTIVPEDAKNHDWSRQAVAELLKDGEFNLRQSKFIRDEKGNLERLYLGEFERQCGAKIPVNIDWKSFLPFIDQQLATRGQPKAYEICAEPIAALSRLCSTEAKDAVVPQVTSIECAFNPKKSVKLDGKTVKLQANFADQDHRAWVENYFGDTLRDGDFSVRQAAFIREEEGNVRRLYADHTESKCGFELDWKIDWKSFEKEIDKRLVPNSEPSIYSVCADPIAYINGLCDSNRKDALQGQLKSLACRFEAKKRAIALKDGAIAMAVNWTDDDNHDWMERYLGNTLRDGDYSVRQAELIRSEEDSFTRLVSTPVSSYCGVDVEWKIDWKSFLKDIDKVADRDATTSFYTVCGAPMSRLADVCLNEKKAPAVKKKVKAFMCKNGGKKGKLSLKSKRFEYAVNLGEKDPYSKIDKFLIKNGLAPKKIKPRHISSEEARRLLSGGGGGGGGSGKQQCQRACTKRCNGASNKSKCVGACRRGC